MKSSDQANIWTSLQLYIQNSSDTPFLCRVKSDVFCLRVWSLKSRVAMQGDLTGFIVLRAVIITRRGHHQSATVIMGLLKILSIVLGMLYLWNVQRWHPLSSESTNIKSDISKVSILGWLLLYANMSQDLSFPVTSNEFDCFSSFENSLKLSLTEDGWKRIKRKLCIT